MMLVPMALVRGFETSSHRKAGLNHILIRMWDEAGRQGWGECAAPSDPYYCPETTETAWHISRDFLAPKLIGQEVAGADDALELMAKVRGNNFARAGLETAVWVLLAERAAKPLAALLGATRGEIVSGVSLGIEPNISALRETVGKFVDEGYKRVKLKIGPGWDVQPVAAVRERWPDLPLQVDANSAYSLAPEHIAALKELDRFGLLMIEQPLADDDIIDHARLQAELATPVCLDESIHSPNDARKALDMGACRIINIKTSRMGGLANAKATHDLCLARGVPVWCGGMHEYGIGRAANVALAALPGFVLPGDVSGSDKYYARDVTTEPIRAHDGAIRVTWDVQGLGYEADLDFIRANTTRGISLRADDSGGWRDNVFASD